MHAAIRNIATGELHRLGDVSLIGRGEGVAVRLTDASVSRQHAAIRHEHAVFWITDLGSANGTFVNGLALTATRVLRNGDKVQLGSVVLMFEESGQAETSNRSEEKTRIARLEPQPLQPVPVTILVGDLKGFTAICARLSAGEVAELLREWYADCDAILKRHGATIDAFIGDGVFAYWHGVDHDIRISALRAAETLRAVETVPASPTRRLLNDRYGAGLDCRIGLHVGRAAVGAMGKGVNTALGDDVNIAFRIEGLTRVIDQPILVSAAFADGFPGEQLRTCGKHTAKGLEEPIEVFGLA